MNVVSYAFFRNDASSYESPLSGAYQGIYFKISLPAVIRAHHSVYRGWEMRIHHDDRVKGFDYWPALEKMHQENVIRLVDMGKSERLCESMLWRILPVWEDGVDHVLCRDIDYISTPREKKAVDRWIESGKPVHALHDNPAHVGCHLMGGMTGFKAPWLRERISSFLNLIRMAPFFGIDLSIHGADQLLLNAEIYPKSGEDGTLEDFTETLGTKEDPRDLFAPFIGISPNNAEAVAWYDEHEPDERIIRCEKVGS